MRKIIYFLFVLTISSCSASKDELFQITDSFVDSLQTTYDSYGMLGGDKFKKITNDGMYQVIPIGRLINVKILEFVDKGVYEELELDLESHYKNDKRVNNIYINNAGTIIIDCRN